MLLPNGRLELTQGAARHASRAAGARPEEIRNQSFACALALAGSGGFREARRFIAYLRLDGTGSGDAHGRRYRLFDDNRFFSCAGGCWGLLLQRMSKPRLRKRQEAHLRMVLSSKYVAKELPASGANASKPLSDHYDFFNVRSRSPP
jgi:hypothetical protein